MSKKKVLAGLIIPQIVYVLFILVWIFVSIASVMMFDSPGSENHLGVWAVFLLIVAYPVGLIAGLLLSWVSFFRRRYRAALLWNGIPLLWVLPIGGFLIYANFFS
ncbi:hypothetical protein [Paenibacillus xanthanilyticus]|uniref:Uncharacterized protein n=1 Tax=Paenibacillus xanthanilyticus TaxID=1783531 RepID=A0ABV8K208_9BACL